MKSFPYGNEKSIYDVKACLFESGWSAQ